MKAALFILIGYTIHNAHQQDSRRLQMPSLLFPTLTAMTTLVTLHIAGFVGTSVSSTKDFILQHVLYQFTTIGPTVLFLSLATLLYAIGYAFATLYDIFLRYQQPTTHRAPADDPPPPSALLLLGIALLLYQLEPTSVYTQLTGTVEHTDIDTLGCTTLYALLLSGLLVYASPHPTATKPYTLY